MSDSDGEQVERAASGGPVTYDPASGRYTYVWGTEPSWKGSCRQLVLKLADGTNHPAVFRFE
jgi:hypothetical protein